MCICIDDNLYICIATCNMLRDTGLAPIGVQHFWFQSVKGWPLSVLMLSSTCQPIHVHPLYAKSSCCRVRPDLHTCKYIYTHIYMYLCIYIYVFIYLFIYLCFYLCIYIYIHMLFVLSFCMTGLITVHRMCEGVLNMGFAWDYHFVLQNQGPGIANRTVQGCA